MGSPVYLPTLRALVWQPFTVKADGPDVTVTVTVAIEAGRTVIDAIEVTRKPGTLSVSAAVLRAIPVGTMARLGVQNFATPVTRRGDELVVPMMGGAPVDANALEAALPARRPRSRSAHDTLLAQVVDAYRRALARGDAKPRVAVASELNISATYVGKLLSEARARKLLGPAPGGGRAGEVPLTSSNAPHEDRSSSAREAPADKTARKQNPPTKKGKKP